jgi:hypothetical protein
MIQSLRGEGEIYEDGQPVAKVRYILNVPDTSRRARITGELAPVEEEGWQALDAHRRSSQLTLRLEDESELDITISNLTTSASLRRCQINARSDLKAKPKS